MKKSVNNREELFLDSRPAWRAWLEKNQERTGGIWLAIAKKHAEGLHYEEAVEEAVCFGWVDSVLNRYDADRYLLWFSPRRPGSNWAASNKERADRMIAEGRICPAGLKAIELAKEDGSWDRLTPVDDLVVPPELEAALKRKRKARELFESLAPSHKKQYIYWIAEAKRDETRKRRVAETVRMLAEGKKPRVG